RARQRRARRALRARFPAPAGRRRRRVARHRARRDPLAGPGPGQPRHHTCAADRVPRPAPPSIPLFPSSIGETPMTREVVIVSGVRTAVGTFGGSLKDHTPTQLGAAVVREAVSRAGLGAEDVQHVVFGHVVNTEPRDMYLARVAALEGGLSKDVPAMTLNRLCGSGPPAIVSASPSSLPGDADAAVAGGAEVMSRGPYHLPQARWGARMGDGKLLDMMVGALHDPFHAIHMGVTAENIAKKWGITRDEQDALAVESHRRAAAAIADGR